MSGLLHQNERFADSQQYSETQVALENSFSL